jgi:hypothetical protein
MKSLLALLLLTFGISAFAQYEHVITIKDRLRYDLWYNGVAQKEKSISLKRTKLPEELSRPLRKF